LTAAELPQPAANDGTVSLSTPNTKEVVLTAKSHYTAETVPVRVLRWALVRVWNDLPLPEGYRLHHEGRCGRCGRLLTVPESITSGYGPECVKHVTGANRRQS
jgi:Family of unknown function (DUF6011)